MSWSDPIADMLTRVRNAQKTAFEVVEIPHSKIKTEIVKILKKEGYISDYVVEGGEKGKILRVYLKYTTSGEPVIRSLKRISSAGLRRYVACDKIPRVLGGMGVVILSTSLGLMTGKEAKKKGVGGEILCTVM